MKPLTKVTLSSQKNKTQIKKYFLKTHHKCPTIAKANQEGASFQILLDFKQAFELQVHLPHQLVAKKQGWACLLPFCQSSFHVLSKKTRMPTGYSPNFHPWQGHGADRLWWKTSSLVCAPRWTKVLPCKTTLWPHQKTKHCSRQGAPGVEALPWLRQKNLQEQCPKGVFGHRSSSETRQYPPSLGPRDK